jgi:hypothetical protein
VSHRTVRCASGATTTLRATVDCNAFNARLRAQKTEHAQLAHRTVYRTCPVHHRTAQRPHQSELQWSEPNDRLTWLAHRTVRCHTGLSGVPAEQRLLCAQRSTATHLMRACARRRQSTRSWRTGQSTGPVRCTTGQPRGPTSQSSNGQNPTTG